MGQCRDIDSALDQVYRALYTQEKPTGWGPCRLFLFWFILLDLYEA